MTKQKEFERVSRASNRLIESGSEWIVCPKCEELVKFRPRLKLRKVICNVYENGMWQRVEHYHEPCYEAAGEPYGTPTQRA